MNNPPSNNPATGPFTSFSFGSSTNLSQPNSLAGGNASSGLNNTNPSTGFSGFTGVNPSIGSSSSALNGSAFSTAGTFPQATSFGNVGGAFSGTSQFGATGSAQSGTTPFGATGSAFSGSSQFGATGNTLSGTTPLGATGNTLSGTTPFGATGNTLSGTTPFGATGNTLSGTTPFGATGSAFSAPSQFGTQTPSLVGTAANAPLGSTSFGTSLNAPQFGAASNTPAGSNQFGASSFGTSSNSSAGASTGTSFGATGTSASSSTGFNFPTKNTGNEAVPGASLSGPTLSGFSFTPNPPSSSTQPSTTFSGAFQQTNPQPPSTELGKSDSQKINTGWTTDSSNTGGLPQSAGLPALGQTLGSAKVAIPAEPIKFTFPSSSDATKSTDSSQSSSKPIPSLFDASKPTPSLFDSSKSALPKTENPATSTFLGTQPSSTGFADASGKSLKLDSKPLSLSSEKESIKLPQKSETLFVPSTIKNKTLQEIATKYALDLENQLKIFKNHATLLVDNDLKIFWNGNEIVSLITQSNELDALSKDVSHQLNFVKTQQSELESMITSLEDTLSSLEPSDTIFVGGISANYVGPEHNYADQNRAELFNCAAQIDQELQSAQNYLTRTDTKTDSLVKGATGGTDSFDEILAILNSNLQTLGVLSNTLSQMEEKGKLVSNKVSQIEASISKMS